MQPFSPNTLQDVKHPLFTQARRMHRLPAALLRNLKRYPWRIAFLIIAIVALLGSALFVHAQTTGATTTAKDTPVVRTITSKERVIVRSGGTDKFFATGYLNYGDKVTVVRESQKYKGWLEIKPPTGSFSWINSLVVKRYGKFIAAVNADDQVPTRIGTYLQDKKEKVGNVENARRLKRGQLLVIVDDKTVMEDGIPWLAVAPVAGDLRYIRAEAVEGSPKESVNPNPNDSNSPSYLIRLANYSYNTRQYCQATQYYVAAAQRTQDYREKLYCYNKLDALEKIGGATSVCLKQPGYPHTVAANNGQNVFQTASRQVVHYQKTPTSRPSQQLQASLAANSPRWSQWGILQRTRFRRQNQPIYALTDGRGRVFAYAMTTSDMTLEPYVSRTICLFGTTNYHSDPYFRNHYVMVSHVALP